MSSYVIGDIQGCHTELCRLLDLIGFSKKYDRVWFTGDLVNRGPNSAKVLREIMALGDAAQSILGNHDFHLLVTASGYQKLNSRDCLDDVLRAKDRDHLLNWLRLRPLAFAADGYLLVHAGAIPAWSADDVLKYASEVETVLHSNDSAQVMHFMKHLYGNKPNRWSPYLRGDDRLRAIVNICTRLRFCAADGEMNFSEKGSRDHPPANMRPWFTHENRRTRNVTMLCGHWSMLGISLMPNVIMLDSGCLWGGMLTTVRLEDRRVFQIPGQAAAYRN